MSGSSCPSRHRAPQPEHRAPRPTGRHALLVGVTAVALAGGGLVAAAHAAEPAGPVPAAAYVAATVYDGAVADPVTSVYRSAGAAGSMAITARLELASFGVRASTAAQLAQAAHRRAAATARAQQLAVAKAKARAAAKARAIARARRAAAAHAALAKAAKAPVAPSAPVAKPPAPAYQGDITRSPAAMSSSAARAAIPLRVWRASATARRVVAGESGGNCREVSASGKYRGCWQMTIGLWKGHGGRAFAPSPELASCAQQDVVAYRIWVEQGWSPWTTA